MAITYLTAINLTQQELQNARIQNLGTDPSTPVEGQIWENTTSHTLHVYDGTAVQTLASLVNRLDQFAVPQSTVSFNNQSLTNLALPVNPNDAATKTYVDQASLGLSVKASVVAATTVAGTLATSFASGQIIDGVTLVTGNRILIKNQASGSDNGIYVVSASGAPVRSADCNSSTNYIAGAFVFIEEGAVNQGAAYVVNTQGTITPGTTSVAWVQFSGTAPTATNLGGGVLGSVPYQSAASTTALLSGNTAATDTVLVSHGTGSTAAAPTFSNAPALSAANMISFPTLNQSTTGNAATATTASTATNVAAGVVGSIPYQSATSATAFLAGNTAATDMVVVSHGTGSAAVAPTLTNAPALSAANLTAFPTLNQNTSGTAAGLSTTLAVTSGGTGGATAAAAKTSLGFITKFAANVGDGTSTSIVVTHNLGTQDVQVSVALATTPFNVVMCDVQLTSINTVTLIFATAPTTNKYRVVVTG
jgi:hypothetical protein